MHRQARPLEVVFLTNFSDTCFRSIPALAQLADDIDVRLTVLHACSEEAKRRDREADIRSFFAEADHYPACERIVIDGDPVDGVRSLHERGGVDLVIAPAGDPLGLPRLGHSSLRSRLIRDLRIPVWTCGIGVTARRMARRARNVVCVLDVERRGLSHVRLASEYATRMGATLHLVQIVPDIDESSLLLAYAEWSCERAHKVVAAAGASDRLGCGPQVSDRRGLGQCLRTCEADVVFLDARPWITRQWLARRVSGALDALPCPVICVDGERRDLSWQLGPSRVSSGLARPATVPAEIDGARVVAEPVLAR